MVLWYLVETSFMRTPLANSTGRRIRGGNMAGATMAGASPATTMRRMRRLARPYHGSGTPRGCHVGQRVPCPLAPYLSIANRVYALLAAGLLVAGIFFRAGGFFSSYSLRLHKYLINAASIHVHNFKAKSAPVKMLAGLRNMSKVEQYEACQRIVGASCFFRQLSNVQNILQFIYR